MLLRTCLALWKATVDKIQTFVHNIKTGTGIIYVQSPMSVISFIELQFMHLQFYRYSIILS